MKVYSGDSGGVFVTIKKRKKKLAMPDDQPISWGDVSAGSTRLAKAILQDVLGDAAKAERLMTRFKHRVVADFSAAWSMDESSVLAVVADIERTEREMAQSRRMVALEPAPIVTDRGADVSWSKEPPLTRNGVKPQ